MVKKVNHDNIFASLPEGSDAVKLAEIIQRSNSPHLHVCIDDAKMDIFCKQISFFSPEVEIIKIPAWDCLPYDRVSPSIFSLNKRAKAICSIANLTDYKNKLIVTTLNSFLQKIPPANLLDELTFSTSVGQKINTEQLTKFLIKSGYFRSVNANEAGEFAVRGSIIDIFPSGEEQGIRLDFFGDEIESIKLFDPLTQLSGKKIESIDLYPASEVILNEDTIKNFRNSYRSMFGSVINGDPLYEAISEGRNYAGMEHWLPLFYDKMDHIIDHLPSPIISYEIMVSQAISERLDTVFDYYQSRKSIMDSAIENKSDDFIYKPIAPDLLFLNEKDIADIFEANKTIKISHYASPPAENTTNFDYTKIENFSVLAKTTGKTSTALLKEHITQKRKNSVGKGSFKTLICCSTEGSLTRIRDLLKEYNFHNIIIDKFEDIKLVKGKTIGLTILDINKGFESDSLLLVSEQDLLGEKIGKKKRSRKRSEDYITNTSALSEGELVVHKEHGLGRFESLETITINDKSHDCLKILYAGGDRIFVPVENIDELSHYGSDSEDIQLDRLGATAWQARKAKIKERIKEIADDLIRVAAERELKKAPYLAPMEGAYDEFCNSFPYVETDDQLKCIEDITRDLASGKPMDRLICGDVGFGKTEVALRAAFIAASNNLSNTPCDATLRNGERLPSAEGSMQVAVIAPTTLLCRQHAKTFKKRFEGFPFIVKDLSRLTKPKDAKETKEGLKQGTVDIVIGTHTLISKSIGFKNLGLVIIDEEQQFGVNQKERFKQLRSDIHLLSLSATPIPRTLQMSLTGIKDLSIIATPPVDRLTIRSFVTPFDKVVIRNAILREHYRGGSTFFVVPRIKDLHKVEEILDKLIPEVKITKAHGQLTPDELDTTMNDFYDGKFDVLLSTNIIGSGIDLPTANTIIIYKSNMFGLSQLYQMRGRVGRGKTRAYAYFTIPEKGKPTKTALKRLDVIQNIDSLGAGFSVASHDMDIRGFGNMLGDEQSGQVKEVGIELYQQMLKEAIETRKAEKLDIEVQESFSPSIKLGLSVLIPENYIADIDLRLELYSRISSLESAEELDEIKVEMIDRFGPLPKEVENLVETIKIKQKCLSAGISKLDSGEKAIVLAFYKNKFKNPESLFEFITKNPLQAKIRKDHKLVLSGTWKDSNAKINAVNKYLDKIISLIM